MKTASVSPQAAMREASPWIERLARLGFAAKGVVYIFVGELAAKAAMGSGGRTTGSRGALKTILQEPFGRTILSVIALGLFGYACWRIIEAVSDPKRRGTTPKGIALRIGSVGKALAYAGLGMSAVRLVMHHSSGGSDDQASHHWTGVALDKPFGRVAVGVIGLSIIGYGIYQLVAAARSKLNKDLVLISIPESARSVITTICRFGIAARGVVFVVIGYFLSRAAFHRAASEAKGVGGALRSFYQHPYGHYALFVVAIGLAAYGIYQLINSRYREIQVA